MIITIDGPAGAGKSSVARQLAQQLGYCFLDTGAMYRAITLAALRNNVGWDETDAIAQLAADVPLVFEKERVFLDQEDVTTAIRSIEVTNCTRHVAGNPQARAQLVALQRRLATGIHVVTEGRDQGTVAFPDADCKFFLTASPQQRAERRVRELQARGEEVTLQQVLDDQNRRDSEDESRTVGRLVPAADAIIVNTDNLDLDQVVAELARRFEERIGNRTDSK